MNISLVQKDCYLQTLFCNWLLIECIFLNYVTNIERWPCHLSNRDWIIVIIDPCSIPEFSGVRKSSDKDDSVSQCTGEMTVVIRATQGQQTGKLGHISPSLSVTPLHQSQGPHDTSHPVTGVHPRCTGQLFMWGCKSQYWPHAAS